MLARFEKQLTREAKSKLTLAAFVPLPDKVDNQRYEPIFDRYPITGKTYTTASGTVVPNEVQYYNGQMVQLYGECTNVAARTAKSWQTSGYKPMTMKAARTAEKPRSRNSGRTSSPTLRFIHTMPCSSSSSPFATIFRHTRRASKPTGMGHRVCSRCSMAPLIRQRQLYENKARLYFARLLDSTRVAIEVGRERMGTDKRPGTIELTRAGRQLAFSIKDNDRNAVAKITFVPVDDPAAYLPEVAKAAATAGTPFREFPPGNRICLSGRRPYRQGAGRELAVANRPRPSLPTRDARDGRLRLELRGRRDVDQLGIQTQGAWLPSQCPWSDHRSAGESVTAASEGPDQGRRGSRRAASEALVGV